MKETREFSEQEIQEKIREIRRRDKQAYDRRRALRALAAEAEAQKKGGKNNEHSDG